MFNPSGTGNILVCGGRFSHAQYIILHVFKNIEILHLSQYIHTCVEKELLLLEHNAYDEIWSGFVDQDHLGNGIVLLTNRKF